MGKKSFPTLAVLGVYTGYCLGDFSDIAEVMDHLYPGVMTMGQAAMQPRAAQVIERQHGQLAELPNIAAMGWRAFVASDAVKALGPTLDVIGPDDVSDLEVSAAFANLKAGDDRASKS